MDEQENKKTCAIDRAAPVSTRKKNKNKAVHDDGLMQKSLKVVSKVGINEKRTDSTSSAAANSKKIKAQVEFGNLHFFVLSEPDFSAFCSSIMLRLCQHFDQREKKAPAYRIELLEHFYLFVRCNKKLFRVDTESDFIAAIYGTEDKLDIVMENK